MWFAYVSISWHSVQSLSCVQLFVTPRTAALQASLSLTISQRLPKFMSIESVMPSNHLILCFPLLILPSIFPNSSVFSKESTLSNRWPKIRASASASVLPINIQVWFPLGLTGLISLLSRELWRVFSRTTVWKHPMVQLSHPSIPDYWKDHSLDYTNLCQQSYVFAFYTLFRFVMALLPRSNCLLIS